MLLKKSLNKFSFFISFILAFIGLSFFSSFKLPFISTYVSNDANKNIILLSISLIAVLFYLIFISIKKEVLLPEKNIAKIFLLAFPILVFLSTLFSSNFLNSFYGKYTYIQSGITYIAIFCLSFIIASFLKSSRRLAWIILVFSNIFVSISAILGLVLFKLGFTTVANKIVYFVDNWDIVSVVSAIMLILSLVYFETIAKTKVQKIISVIFIAIHTILIAFIIIPDIWYAIGASSLFVLLISRSKLQKTEEGEEKRVNIPLYERASLYILIISVFFSLVYSLQFAPAKKITTAISNFSNKYIGITYSFVKPKLNLSFDLAVSELKRGRILGSGPAEFYKVWQREKSQDIINSAYWGTEFSASYSAFTTLAVSLGIVGILFILATIVFTSVLIVKKIKSNFSKGSYIEHDEESRFYFLASTALFILSVFLFVFFANIIISVIIFALSLALVLSNTLKWREHKASKLYLIFVFILFIGVLAGFIVAMNRIRSVYLSNKAMANFQNTQDINRLEKDLTKSSRIANDDSSYRLLTQFYLFKTRQILNDTSTTTDKETLQREVITSMNNAITSAKTAIDIDKKDYNNYVTLGSVYAFLMTFDTQNKDVDYQNAKDSYNKAISLYPKNPSLFLNLADLEYAYSQNSTTTIETIKKSLDIKPNYSSAYYFFSQLAAQNNDRESAIAYAAQAIQADPNDVQAYLQYGILILNKKDLSKEELNQAYAAFTSILNIDPKNQTAAYYLAITYILAGDFENGENMINALKQVLPNDSKIAELESFLINSKKGTTNENTTATTTKKK